jgi:hypothetical protein
MPASNPGPGAGHASGARDGAAELLHLVVAYAKQETLDPVLAQLKSLARGIAGAVLLAAGTVLLAIGFVRALQSVWGSTAGARASSVASYGSGAPLAGNWSWVPYFGGVALCLAVAAFCVIRIVKGARR